MAYHSAQRLISSTAVLDNAPFPEVFPTGEYALEPNIGLTRDGTIFVSGADCDKITHTRLGPLVLRSTDEGQTFKDVSPTVAGQPGHPLTEDPYLYVDKGTDRVFTTDILVPPGCDPFSFSADHGAAWTVSQVCGLSDHQNVFTGPPPRGGEQTTGYPNVVYYCAIDVGALAGATSKATSCQKSLDGGMTFARTGDPAYLADPASSVPDPARCDGATGPGFVDAQGTVYLPRGFCGQPYLAVSHDEGKTWTRTEIANNGMGTQNDDGSGGLLINHEAGVVVDQHGTIYYTWVAHDRLPYLAVSRDGAKSWSPPAMIGPPGVRQAWNPAIDIAPSGRIALAYLASTNAPGGPFDDDYENTGPDSPYKSATFNGYITITDDADGTDPTYYTASVNAGDHPFIKGPCGQIRCAQEFDFIDVAIGRDNIPWAIFVDACGNGQKDCIAPQAGAGVAARLVTPAVATISLPPASEPGTAPPASAPSRAPCRSRRNFRIRLRPRDTRLRSAQVFVNGVRVRVIRGRRLRAPIDLRGLPRGRYTVRVIVTTARGKRLVATRRYRTCTPRRTPPRRP